MRDFATVFSGFAQFSLQVHLPVTWAVGLVLHAVTLVPKALSLGIPHTPGPNLGHESPHSPTSL